MTRVFLSYAEEDQAVGNRLAQRLTEAGLEPLWWRNAAVRGRNFVAGIDRDMRAADCFLALVSPHFLASRWCQGELEQAVVRHRSQPGQFIYVAQVAEISETAVAESGWLTPFDRMDLTPPLDDRKLDVVVDVLRAAGGLPPGNQPEPEAVFRNRDDELGAILHALSTTGGDDTWLVISPPRMGKSWFLGQLHSEMAKRDGTTVRMLDLREHPAELRTDAPGLLGELLGLNGTQPRGSCPLPSATRNLIAVEINRRRTHEVCLLDSADLLDTQCALDLRSEIADIYRKLQRIPRRASRLSVILAGRRDDEWKGFGRDVESGVRFRPVPLTQFSVGIVHQALAELDLAVDGGKLWDYANRLHRLSEGLPALLVRGLRWAQETEFLELEDSDQESTFDTVARPYIRDDLLAEESLLPFGADDPPRAKALIERTLRVLVTYRLFTQSHLRFHVEADPEFRAELAAANWTLAKLWHVVGRTAILKRPLDELWQVIDPPIRRLLYRYYYGTDDARREAHEVARRFYEGWTDSNAGKEQVVVLVECLWHEASRMLVDARHDLPDLLPGVARQLAGEFTKSPIYESEEFSDFVARRLQEDEEFQLILHRFDDVFDTVRSAVVDTIRGGA